MTAREAQQHTAGRVAGFLLLSSPVTIIAVSYGIVWPLVSGVDATRAAHNIVENEALFRIGLVGNLAYTVEILALSAALYVALRAVDPLLALLAALGRLLHAVTWVVICVGLSAALRLLTDVEYGRVLPADELHVLARLCLSGFDRYYVALLFWALGTMVAAYAWLISRTIPRPLAAFGMLASAWAVFCTVSLFLDPRFQETVHLAWFDVPMLAFELAVGGLLLLRAREPGSLA